MGVRGGTSKEAQRKTLREKVRGRKAGGVVEGEAGVVFPYSHNQLCSHN